MPKPRRPLYDYRLYEPYLPPDNRYGKWPYSDNTRYYVERDRDRNYWGLNRKGYTWGTYGRPVSNYDNYQNRRNSYDYDRNYNYYLPSKIENTRNWGVYGGNYGTGQTYFNKHQDQLDYWGLHKPSNSASFNNAKYYNYGELPPYQKPASSGVTYLPVNTYDRPRSFHSFGHNALDSQEQHFSIPKRPVGYNFIEEGGIK